MLESGLIPFAPHCSGVPAKDHRELLVGKLPGLVLAAWTRRQETRVSPHLSLSGLEKVTFTLMDKFFIFEVKRAEPDAL